MKLKRNKIKRRRRRRRKKKKWSKNESGDSLLEAKVDRIGEFGGVGLYRSGSKVAWMSRPLTIVRFMVATVGTGAGQTLYDSGLVTLDFSPGPLSLSPRDRDSGLVIKNITVHTTSVYRIFLLSIVPSPYLSLFLRLLFAYSRFHCYSLEKDINGYFRLQSFMFKWWKM